MYKGIRVRDCIRIREELYRDHVGSLHTDQQDVFSNYVEIHEGPQKRATWLFLVAVAEGLQSLLV